MRGRPAGARGGRGADLRHLAALGACLAVVALVPVALPEPYGAGMLVATTVVPALVRGWPQRRRPRRGSRPR